MKLFILFVACLFICPIGRADAEQSRNVYVIDGLALGGRVRPDSSVYKEYRCNPSTQYQGFTICRRRTSETKDGRSYSASWTILHSEDGVVAYINRTNGIAPSSSRETEEEISRLSQKYGQTANIVRPSDRKQFGGAQIAVWGSIKLVPLVEDDMEILRRGESAGRGMLADYLDDFSKSSLSGLPVFSFGGEFGAGLITNSDGKGRGFVRSFAIDAGVLRAALTGPLARAPGSSRPSANTVPTPPASPPNPLLTQLSGCGESCPDNPEVDTLRKQTLDDIQKLVRITEDASRFEAAIGSEASLQQYITSCEQDSCNYQNEAKAELDAIRGRRSASANAASEEQTYRNSQGDVTKLKKYVADCDVCAFAQQAVRQIQEISATLDASFFKFSICNNDPISIDVALVGSDDPFLKMKMTRGWYIVQPGECKQIGPKFVKGDFYVMARNKRGIWSGNKEGSYCVTLNDRFSKLSDSDDDCSNSETFSFHHLNIQSSEYTWRLNGTPWSYSAAAFSPFSSSWGFSGTGHSTRQEAEKSALESCGQYALDCHIGGTARDDSCVAISSGTNNSGTSIGIATGDSRYEARNSANNTCQSYDGYGCHIVAESCN